MVQRQVPCGADAAQGSEAQQSQSIDETIDITVSVQRQKAIESKRFQQDSTVKGSRRSWRFRSEDRGDFIQKIMEVPQVRGFRKSWRFPSFQYTVKMVDDTAENSEDSADATGPVH